MKIEKLVFNITAPMTVNVEVGKQTNIESDTKRATQLRTERALWLETQYAMEGLQRQKAAQSAEKYAAFTDTMMIMLNRLPFAGFVPPVILRGMANTDKD